MDRDVQARRFIMDQLSLLAASGLRARMESLDMLANNLANAGTAGFKVDREFYSLYVGSGSGLNPADPLAVKSPVIEKQWTDFTQGLLQVTGNPADLALSGKGLFTVAGPSGPLYTRSGSFQISRKGTLDTAEGYPLVDTTGKPLKVSPEVPFEIGVDGVVRQAGQEFGQLKVVEFADTTVLAKQGNTYFRNVSDAVKPKAASKVEVLQGKIEASNVGSAESAVRLIGIMRQFEMLQKAIGISSEMNRKSMDEVAKLGA